MKCKCPANYPEDRDYPSDAWRLPCGYYDVTSLRDRAVLRVRHHTGACPPCDEVLTDRAEQESV